ncbi:MAG: PQQ-binding-like beta-propeller repeat protein, partial [Myxococcales bacterium]|nr:PQQ-binding-like beta-propeller repeat protein [Myxococcales bacterium]
GIVLLCGLIYGIYWVGTKIRYELLGGKEADAKARLNTAEFWLKGDPGRALPIELNGDGAVDFLGGYRGFDPSGDYLGAFDGKTGNVLWRVGPIKFGLGPTLYTTSENVLIVGYPQDLVLVELKSGKELQRAQAPHAIREFCPDPSGKPNVVLRNYNQVTQLSLVDLGTAAGDASWCGAQMIPGVGKRLSGVTPPEGMNASARILEDEAGNRFFTGLKTSSGGPSPVLIAQDQAGAHLWSQTYPGTTPPWVALAEGRAYVVSNFATPPALTAYDAKTGTQLWKNTTANLLVTSGVSASKDAVYVQVGKGLCLFDPKDGKLKATLGDAAAL